MSKQQSGFCPQCMNPITDYTVPCPHCGCVFSTQQPLKVFIKLPPRMQPASTKSKTSVIRTILKIMVAIPSGFFLASVIFMALFYGIISRFATSETNTESTYASVDIYVSQDEDVYFPTEALEIPTERKSESISPHDLFLQYRSFMSVGSYVATENEDGTTTCTFSTTECNFVIITPVDDSDSIELIYMQLVDSEADMIVEYDLFDSIFSSQCANLMLYSGACSWARAQELLEENLTPNGCEFTDSETGTSYSIFVSSIDNQPILGMEILFQ